MTVNSDFGHLLQLFQPGDLLLQHLIDFLMDWWNKKHNNLLITRVFNSPRLGPVMGDAERTLQTRENREHAELVSQV